MKTALHVYSCLVIFAAICAQGRGEEPRQVPISPGTCGPDAPACVTPCARSGGLHWTRCCFPRGGCPDDYCANPYPRQCWLHYPSFYKCVPAGGRTSADCYDTAKENQSWWWVPTPRALRDAIWRSPAN
jgi:hypothetical protein